MNACTYNPRTNSVTVLCFTSFFLFLAFLPEFCVSHIAQEDTDVKIVVCPVPCVKLLYVLYTECIDFLGSFLCCHFLIATEQLCVQFQIKRFKFVTVCTVSDWVSKIVCSVWNRDVQIAVLVFRSREWNCCVYCFTSREWNCCVCCFRLRGWNDQNFIVQFHIERVKLLCVVVFWDWETEIIVCTVWDWESEMLKVLVFSFRLREWNCCVQFHIERVNLCVLFQIKRVKCSKFVCSVSDGEWYFGVFSLILSDFLCGFSFRLRVIFLDVQSHIEWGIFTGSVSDWEGEASPWPPGPAIPGGIEPETPEAYAERWGQDTTCAGAAVVASTSLRRQVRRTCKEVKEQRGYCMLLAGRSEGLAKKLRNKGVTACYWQAGQKDLQRS